MMSSAHESPEAGSGLPEAAPPGVSTSGLEVAAPEGLQTNLSSPWPSPDGGASEHLFEEKSEEEESEEESESEGEKSEEEEPEEEPEEGSEEEQVPKPPPKPEEEPNIVLARLDRLSLQVKKSRYHEAKDWFKIKNLLPTQGLTPS
ncbi:uncharacterized protein [Muntiacus reevesi]|uniref:uncharacterized protein isoform X2 n=1 Tax=Muntiacus reevesi TaxID=9886 RepID=UPI003306ACB2